MTSTVIAAGIAVAARDFGHTNGTPGISMWSSTISCGPSPSQDAVTWHGIDWEWGGDREHVEANADWAEWNATVGPERHLSAPDRPGHPRHREPDGARRGDRGPADQRSHADPGAGHRRPEPAPAQRNL